ncbi:sigma 54-interacting transcriptional regulator, partial [uncultured Sphingomonas sp.]
MTRNGQRLLMLIDADAAQQRQLSALAARGGWRTVAVPDGAAALALLAGAAGRPVDAVLLDHAAIAEPVADVIAALHERRPALPVLVLTAHESVADAVAAMRAGAVDFLVRPVAPQRFVQALEAALAGSVSGELRPLTEKIPALLGFDEIVGSAPDFRAALAVAAKAARARVPVLIDGEPGVGKEVVAEAIHAASPRAAAPRITVNCAAIATNLIESELFGHEQGAFAGAFERRIGQFVHADGGTLFLDEVDHLPLDAQAALLRVLHSEEVVPLGGRHPRAVDVRVIAATNKRLLDEVAA